MAKPLNDNIRDRIMQTAKNLLAQQSFSDISLAIIAKKAKISKGTLYYHYNNKYDILCDIASEYLNKLADELIVWVDNRDKDTSTERLARFVLERGVGDENGNLRIYLISEAVSGNGEVAQKLKDQYRIFKELLAKRIKERGGKDPEYAAWLMLALCDGLMVQTQLKNSELDIPEFIRKTAALVAGL